MTFSSRVHESAVQFVDPVQTEAAIRVGNRRIGFSGKAMPGEVPWGDIGCDIVLAARSARFGYPEVKIGFVPAMVMAILRRNVSEKRAFELVALGAEVGAEEAERVGLVNRVFDDESFETEVESYVHSFERVSRSAVSLTKRLLYQMDGMSFDDALTAGVDVNTIARMTDDCRAGVARFLDRAKRNERD